MPLPVWVRLAPVLTIGLLLGPAIAGLLGIVAPAFGIAPLFGHNELSLSPFITALSTPGFARSAWLSFWIGPATAAISLIVVVLFVAATSGTRLFGLLLSGLRPALAVPHAAAAFGLAFLLMPSGFLLRLVSPALTGFERPPDWLIVNDPAGFALLAGLVIKEIPFLLLVTLAALPQVDARQFQVARTLGLGRVWAWLIAVFPAVYAQIRLPVYAVIVFAGSVVDMALVLGPGTPPPLAIRILHWMQDPDLRMRLAAAAAAILQFGVTLAALGLWWLLERGVARLGKALALGGVRLHADTPLRYAGIAGVVGAGGLLLSGIALLGLNSVAGSWRFPQAWPEVLTLHVWQDQGAALLALSLRSVAIALAATLIAAILVLGCLENEYRRGKKPSARARLVLFVPLLVPQISFLPGLTTLFLRLGIDGTVHAVVLSHLIFILPYTYLMLADSWNAFDTRYLDLARSLGKTPTAALLTVRLPILLRPMLAALALGFAVSIAQYLPTLLVGGGRTPTITTEAVALASGGNRRLIGAYALVQTALGFFFFALATLLPAFLWRQRRALQSGGVR